MTRNGTTVTSSMSQSHSHPRWRVRPVVAVVYFLVAVVVVYFLVAVVAVAAECDGGNGCGDGCDCVCDGCVTAGVWFCCVCGSCDGDVLISWGRRWR